VAARRPGIVAYRITMRVLRFVGWKAFRRGTWWRRRRWRGRQT